MSNRVIWKYRIVPNDQSISLPRGAEFLCVQMQQGYPHAWCLVDPDAEPELRHLKVFETGQVVDRHDVEGARYLGTFQTHHGHVYHVWYYPTSTKEMS